MEENKASKKVSIKIVGHDYIDAFENVERTGNQPHYTAPGVAVWVYDLKPKGE